MGAHRRLLVPLALAVALLAGCGGGDDNSSDASNDPAAAKVFADAGCGGCHTLSAAGSNGTTGPNLDQLKPSKDRVAKQVEDGGNGMPAFGDKLSDEEIDQVAEFVSSSAGGGSAKKITFEPNDKKLEDCPESDSSCLQQAFGNLAYDDGPKTALAKLEQMQTTNTAVQAGCHQIAHMIGAGGLKHFDGNVGKAFADGNGTCGSGYYHGLLQWKLAGVDEDEADDVAREACEDPSITSNAFIYYQCVHGLGHGLMLYTGYELPLALNMCHGLKDNFEQVSCSGGVFMENLSSSFGLKSRWLKDDNLLYPCNIVSHQDKLYCYLLVTSRILPQVGWNWKKAADWCRRSDREFVNICFQSYGRDASGAATQNPGPAKSYCAQAGSGERVCIYGVARDLMNNNSHDPRVREFCNLVAAKFRDYCFYGIGTIIGTQNADAASRRQACTEFAKKPRDLANCVDGAG